MMDCFEAEKVIASKRGDAIVIAVMTAAREWPQISTTALDLAIGGAMGMASSLGLGIALAAPTRKVIVLDGDGSLLMHLPTLVTIANMAPRNLFHFVLENDVYRTTGGQPIPNAGKVSFAGLAKAAGYPHTYEFDKLDDLEKNIGTILSQKGPTFTCLKVLALEEKPPFFQYPFPDREAQLNSYSRVRKAIQGVPAR